MWILRDGLGIHSLPCKTKTCLQELKEGAQAGLVARRRELEIVKGSRAFRVRVP